MQLTTTNQRGFAPTTLTEAIQFSEMLASSSMVPRAYQGKPNDVLVCLQWGYEMGMAPMCENIEEYFENEGTPNPVAVCVAKRKGRTPVIFKFSVEDAKRAGLWGKTGPWQAYPKRMMQMRARGFALRDAFADVLTGLITAEEAHDYPAEEKSAPAPRQAPANPLDMVAKPVELEAPAEPEVLEPVAEVAEVVEVVEHVELQPLVERVSGEDDDLGEVEPIGFAVRVPGKEQPYSVHDTLEAWADAYEELAEKTAKAGKRPARERMTILKELKECNQETIGRIDTMKRIRHTANYQKRINALGAAQ